jgi:SpoVK/Ycf46/Vps4 family AAA+-type ATPase
MVASEVISRNGVVLLVQKISNAILALSAIREIEPERPLMTVTEDLDEYFQPGKDNTKQVLSMYDGENQVDHVMHLATTNHPEVLEDRIIQRPSRFDLVLLLGTPNRDARQAYLRNILHEELQESEFQKIVDGTKGLSLSHLKEYVVSTVVLGKEPKQVLARLHSNMKKKPTLEKGSVLGFRGEGFEIYDFDQIEKIKESQG